MGKLNFRFLILYRFMLIFLVFTALALLYY